MSYLAHGASPVSNFSIFECFIMFGSWLLTIWLGVLPALACNLGGALFLAIVAIAAKKNIAWRRAGIFGGILLAVWGILYALMRPGLAF